MTVADARSFSVDLTQGMVDQFAQLSGDTNPIHVDVEAGERSEFRGRIAHGALLLAQVSRFLGMEIPGPGCVIMAMDVRFPKALKPPEKLIVRGQLTTYSTERRDGKVKVTVESAQGMHVEAHVHFMQMHQATTPLIHPATTSSLNHRASGPFKRLLMTGGSGGVGSPVLKTLSASYDCLAVSRQSRAPTDRVEWATLDLESDIALDHFLMSVDPKEFWGIVHMSSSRPSRTKISAVDTDLKLQLHHTVHLPVRLVQWATQEGSSIRRVILIGSIFGTKQLELSTPSYSLAKSLVSPLAQLLAAETSRLGATVNAIAPGFIPVGMNDGVPQRRQAALAGLTPTGRLTAPEDLANLIQFLLSDAAAQINGSTLTIDGGYLGS